MILPGHIIIRENVLIYTRIFTLSIIRLLKLIPFFYDGTKMECGQRLFAAGFGVLD